MSTDDKFYADMEERVQAANLEQRHFAAVVGRRALTTKSIADDNQWLMVEYLAMAAWQAAPEKVKANVTFEAFFYTFAYAFDYGRSWELEDR